MQHIWEIFNNMHIHVKEMQLKLVKGKISKIISFTHYSFSFGKRHRNDNWFHTKIYNGVCWNLFSIRKQLWIPRKILQRYHPGQLQYKIPIDITFFSRVLKPDKLEGVLNENSWKLFWRNFWMDIVWTLRYLITNIE